MISTDCYRNQRLEEVHAKTDRYIDSLSWHVFPKWPAKFAVYGRKNLNGQRRCQVVRKLPANQSWFAVVLLSAQDCTQHRWTALAHDKTLSSISEDVDQELTNSRCQVSIVLGWVW